MFVIGETKKIFKEITKLLCTLFPYIFRYFVVYILVAGTSEMGIKGVFTLR